MVSNLIYHFFLTRSSDLILPLNNLVMSFLYSLVVFFFLFTFSLSLSLSLSGTYAGLILGRCGFRKKMGVRGLPPRKLIPFYRFVNGIMISFVNFLEFVIFFLLFSRFFSYWFFFAPPLHTRLITPMVHALSLCSVMFSYKLRSKCQSAKT